MAELFEQTLESRPNVNICVSQNTWAARADRHQLEVAVLNLLINAKEATEDGDSLYISCFNFNLEENDPMVSDDFQVGDYVGLRVSDTGAGMSAEVLQRAIEPFFTTKGLNEGSGLGLPMAHGFAKQSGGHLLIDSVPGGVQM